jgi:16S rRNA (guanine527-N7)-methyltransferase
MSAKGRPEREYRSAQHEGSPVSPIGRPRGEHRSAQHGGSAAPIDAAIDDGVRALGLALPPGAAAQLSALIALLAKWNGTYNLTAIREPAKMVTHHLIDSLAVLTRLAVAQGARLVDIGCGAGLPGLPLAIARPDVAVTLLDSNGKKIAFVRQAIGELGLGNATAVAARAETFVPAAPFDVVVSRAFSDLATFVAAGRRLLAPGAVLVAMKGVLPAAEIAALPPGIRVVAAPALAVPGVEGQRHLVIMNQESGP